MDQEDDKTLRISFATDPEVTGRLDRIQTMLLNMSQLLGIILQNQGNQPISAADEAKLADIMAKMTAETAHLKALDTKT